MRLLPIFTLFFIAVNATATVIIIDVTGASRFENTTSGTTTTQTVYGGTGGPQNASCFDNTDGYTCNNCNLAATGVLGAICNEKRIKPTVNLTITAKPSTAGILSIFNSSTKARINGSTTVNIPTANTSGSITVPWSQICLSYTTTTLGTVSATCEFSASTPFNIGIDKNGNGIQDTDDDVTSLTIVVNNAIGGSSSYATASDASLCTTGDCLYPLTVRPGDEKVYLGPLPAVGTFPESNLVPFTHLRFYISTIPITDIANTSIADLGVTGSTSEYSVSPDYVDGLVNGQAHYFIIAQVDKAGNVGFFNLGLATVTPDVVYGMLSKDFECFVATATYGSPEAKEVKTLRRFRKK